MKQKFKKVFLLLLLTIFFIPFNVFASNKVTLKTSDDDLTIGDEITVSANLSSDKKLFALTAALSYDEKVFERIDKDNFEKTAKWSEVIYNADNKKLGLINESGEIRDNLLTVRLKVRKNADVGKSYITLTNIKVSDGKEKLVLDDASVKVLVTRDAKENETLPLAKTKKDEKIEDKVIKTFTTHPLTIAVIISIILLTLTCFELRKEKRKSIILIILIILLTIGLILLLSINNSKKDVNKDGTNNYDDAEEIIKYLIDIKGEEEQELDDEINAYKDSDAYKSKDYTPRYVKSRRKYLRLKRGFRADVNNNGYVDVVDAANSTQNTTENINYKVSLSEAKDNERYLEKNTKTTLNFKADVSPYQEIKKVIIDDKEYPVVRNNDYYSVALDTPKNSGVHDFHFSKVLLANNRLIDVNFSIKCEVLKDKPYDDMLVIDEENDTLSFKIVDNDHALLKQDKGYGTVVVTNDKGEEVINDVIYPNENHNFHYKFERGVEYTITITASYDLDTNALNSLTGPKNKHENEIITHQKFTIQEDYDFKIDNVMITDAVELGKHPVITFESSNVYNYLVKEIYINGHKYEVEKLEDNKYQVELNHDIDNTNHGKHEVNIEKVVLSNLKIFENEKDFNINKLTYTILKNAPTIDNVKLVDNEEEKTITATHSFHDKDDTYRKLVAILMDSTGKTLDSKEIKPNESVELSYAKDNDGRLTVKFLADYNLGTERHDYSTVLKEESILLKQDIYISNVTVAKVYPAKKEPQYKVTYDVYVGEGIQEKCKETYKIEYNSVSSITINGYNYEATATGKKAFQVNVSFTVPDESGVIELEATKVQLQYEDYNRHIHNFFAIPEKTIKIDVLKDKPSIEDLAIEEDYEKEEATFKFNVKEDRGINDTKSFEKGKVVLNHEEKPIHLGENTVKFTNVKTDETFDLEFLADYDLDTNIIPEVENQNHYTDSLIHKVSYGLYDEEMYNAIEIKNLNIDKKYYEKNEKVNLTFNLEGMAEELKLDISKVLIGDKEYSVERDNDLYKVTLEGYPTAGVKKPEITEVILNNGRKVKLKNPVQSELEVLKDKVKIEDYKYSIKDNSIDVNLKLKDHDLSISGNAEEEVVIKVFDEDNHLLDTYPYSDNITIKKRNDITRYYLKVYAKYDRDIHKFGENYYEEVLLDEVISLEKPYIEVKDITDVTLYTEENDEVITVDRVNVDDIKRHPDKYFIKIDMSNTPSMRAKIKEVLTDDGNLVLVLDYENIINENESDLRINFGKINGNYAQNEARPETLESLLRRIKEDPTKDYKLERDLDAKDYQGDDNFLADVSFSGTLDGAGHTIKNLTKPLFRSIDKGTVKNLNLENVNLISSAQGPVANTATAATLKNILVDKMIKNSSVAQSGGLIGAVSNTTIDTCRVTNLNLGVATNTQQIGGLVGALNNNSTIKNSYAIGKISANYNFIGGLVGNVVGTSTIQNSYAKVDLSNADVSCGIACSWQGKINAKDNLSLSTNYKSGIVNKPNEYENNYYLDISSKEDINQKGLIRLKNEADINDELFLKKLNFDAEIWDLKNTSYNNTPIFKIERKFDPDKLKDYDEEKTILYNNLSQLMPYYNYDKIVELGANISKTDILNQDNILHIVPVDASGNIVTYLTSDSPNKIKKIKVVFKNQSKIEYDVHFDNVYDIVANYRISSLKVDYTFNHFVISSNSQLVNNLVNYLDKLVYEDNLDPLTKAADSRIYKDYYYENTKGELKEFVLKYLANSDYTNTSDNQVINDYLEKEIKKDKKLEKILYVYNYFHRFYDVDVAGMKLDDFILFNFNGFNNMSVEDFADNFLANEQNMTLSTTNETYKRVIGNYTKLENVTDFLEYMVKEFSDIDPRVWYRDHFRGIIKEINIDGHDEVEYTLWDHIKNKDTVTGATWYNYALPIITLPDNAGYIISTPTQYVIGSQRTYIKDPSDPALRKSLENRIEMYAKRYKQYYTTTYNILADKKYLNDIHTIQIDKRFAYDENGVSIFQQPNTTKDPFHKNFNEIIGQWAFADSNAATANGAYIIWRAEGVMDGNLDPTTPPVLEYTYHTWTHETAHNMDSRLFLKNLGRRFDAGGEDYADGNLTQSFGPGDIVMNLSVPYPKGSRIGANLSPEEINTTTKIHNYYKKLFQVLYIMDYIEGQAFLRLSNEEKAKVAVQLSYPNENEEKYNDEKLRYLKRKNSKYTIIPKEDYDSMELNDIEDLYENHLVIFPNRPYESYSSNLYGGENIYKVRWYQAHNDEGRPDSYSLKWFAYEMLGYAGYDDGYIAYYSNIDSTPKEFYKDESKPENGVKSLQYKTDLMALENITGEKSFKDYKMKRFKEVENNLDKINSAINVNQVYEEFYNALKEDAKLGNTNIAVGRGKVKVNGSDAREKVFYMLKEATDDFAGDIYSNTKTQDIKPFPEIGKEDPANILTEESNEVGNIDVPKEDTDLNEQIVGDIEPQDKTTIPDANKPTPSIPEKDPAIVTKPEEDEEKEGMQQDDPTTATGGEPDPNPDNIKTTPVVIPTS